MVTHLVVDWLVAWDDLASPADPAGLGSGMGCAVNVMVASSVLMAVA